MTAVRTALDFTVDLAIAGVWTMAAFFAAAGFISMPAGTLLALAVFVTGASLAVLTQLEERNQRRILEGRCPGCHADLSLEHEHRRWDTPASSWLPPLTLWRCRSCGFQDGRQLACEKCPATH